MEEVLSRRTILTCIRSKTILHCLQIGTANLPHFVSLSTFGHVWPHVCPSFPWPEKPADAWWSLTWSLYLSIKIVEPTLIPFLPLTFIWSHYPFQQILNFSHNNFWKITLTDPFLQGRYLSDVSLISITVNEGVPMLLPLMCRWLIDPFHQRRRQKFFLISLLKIFFWGKKRRLTFVCSPFNEDVSLTG